MKNIIHNLNYKYIKTKNSKLNIALINEFELKGPYPNNKWDFHLFSTMDTGQKISMEKCFFFLKNLLSIDFSYPKFICNILYYCFIMYKYNTWSTEDELRSK